MLNKPKFVLLLLLTTILGFGEAGFAQRPYRVRDEQVQTLLDRIATRTDSFRRNLGNALDQSRYDGTRQEGNINRFAEDFAAANDRLQQKFRERRETRTDVEDLLSRGLVIDNFIKNNRMYAAQRDWNDLRVDLKTLANYYNVNWLWDNASSTGYANNGYRNNRLTGTYELDLSRSDNAEDAINRAIRGLSSDDSERIRTSLQRRLSAPERLAIDQSNRQFTIISTTAPQITFDADGRTQEETRPNGRIVKTTTTLSGNRLVISSLGDRGSDFSVTFEPINNGNALRVTRELYTDRLTSPVVVQSIYRKTSEVAQMNIFEGRPSQRDSGSEVGDNRTGYYIPDNTRLTAVLNTDLSTRNVREGDSFTMTVRSPREYEDATIEGVVTRVERSGQLSGRSRMSLDFRQIRLANGNSYPFSGYIENVRMSNGDRVTVDNEGTVKDQGSQTSRTTTRAGIGAAIGAIIGGIAGGGKGAVLGAVLGGGAGAGTVILQGRDDLNLTSGTEFTITVAAPHNNLSSR